MFTVILHKDGGVRCEILCKKSKNAGTPPNNLVKIEISNLVKIKNCGIKILEFDFFQFFDYNKDRNFETGVE